PVPRHCLPRDRPHRYLPRRRRNMNHPACLVAGLLTCAALIASGCASDNSQSQREMYPSAEVNRPPKQLVEDIRRIVEAPPLALGVTGVHDGTIVTDYQPFRGELHIVR